MRTSGSRVRGIGLVLGVTMAMALSACGTGTAGGTNTPTTNTPTTTATSAKPDPTKPERDSFTGSVYRSGMPTPFFVAKDNGYFAKYGVTFNYSFVGSSAAGMAEMIGGDTDLTYSSFWGVMDSVSNGVPLVILMEAVRYKTDQLTFETLSDSGITKPCDAAGKTVTVPALNSSHQNRLEEAMIQDGCDPASVKFVELPYSEVESALVNHTADMVAVDALRHLQLKQKYQTTTVLDLAGGRFAGVAEGAYVMKQDFAQANPNLVAAIQCGFVAGAAASTEDGYKNTLINYLDYTPDDAQAAVSTMPLYPTTTDAKAIQDIPDTMVQLGLLDKTINVADIIVPMPDNC